MKNNSFILLILLLTTYFITEISCKKPEDKHDHPENEFISTVKIVAIHSTTNDTVTAYWRQLDVGGTTPPDTSLAHLVLKSNSLYNIKTYFLDETKTPAENITTEIKDRGIYHGVFYIPDANLSPHIAIVRTDKDANNLPLGLEATFETFNTTANAYLRVVLRHQPEGKDGTFAPGSTDADTAFRIEITP